MKVKFNFNLSAWVDEVEIYADSVEEAKENLLKMTAEDLVESGYVKESDVSDISYEIEEVDYTVKAYNIKYGESFKDWEYMEDQLTDLPNEFIFEISCNPKDLEDEIKSEIEYKVEYEVLDFDYKIIEEK